MVFFKHKEFLVFIFQNEINWEWHSIFLSVKTIHWKPLCVALFSRSQYFLGGIGYFRLVVGSKGKIHLRYSITNTKDILEKVLPYFSLLYGQKRADMAKLNRIFQLSTNPALIQSFHTDLASELIHLVYSMNPESQDRKVLLAEKLKIYHCNTYKELFIKGSVENFSSWPINFLS